jgi:hypothetical protein
MATIKPVSNKNPKVATHTMKITDKTFKISRHYSEEPMVDKQYQC